MSVYNPDAKVIVIDTAQYAGNFEREMVAFITGQVGECGVGDGVAEEERENIANIAWFDGHAVQVADDNGCERPASIWPSPGRFNDGYGGHHDDTKAVRDTLPAQVAKARWPAYESVAFFVDELPPEAVLTEVVERARRYCEDEGLTYLNCRLLVPRYQAVTVQKVVGHDEVCATPQRLGVLGYRSRQFEGVSRMSRFFIFGYDTYYPQGGMSDLVCVLAEEAGEHTGTDLLIKPDVLAATLVARQSSKEHYQVLQFCQDGKPLLVETWQRLSHDEVNARPGRLGRLVVPMGKGHVLTLKEVRTDFEDKLVR